jgi:DNA-binding NarL/FixJ family response regulator
MSDTATVAPRGTPLTDRERQVLLAIATTGDLPGAARKLGLSYHTVRGHAQNARSRLGVRTTLQAIMKVLA